MITVTSSSRYSIDRKQLIHDAENIMERYGIEQKNNVNLVFVGKTKMRDIANTYKHEDEALPVLTFKYDQNKDEVWGEIFLCYPQIILLAAERDRSLEDTLKWLIEHGIQNLLK